LSLPSSTGDQLFEIRAKRRELIAGDHVNTIVRDLKETSAVAVACGTATLVP
jgi:hypothetical protein